MGHSSRTQAGESAFGKVAQEFLQREQQRLAPGTFSRLSRLITTFTRYFGESTTIESISEGTVERFVVERGRLLASSSLALRLKILKQIFAFSVKRGLIHHDPTKGIRMPSVKEPQNRFLTQEEYSRVLQASPEWLQPIVEVSVAAGLRRGEIVNLKWDDVDEREGIIRVRTSSGPKVRLIPLNDLGRHAINSARMDCVGQSAYVFSRGSIKSDKISVAFMRACRSVGVEGVSFRHLRNTAANWMANDGVNIPTISKFLGTKNSEATARYLGRSESRLEDAIAAIDRIVMTGKTRSRTQRKSRLQSRQPSRDQDVTK
jgi:integrase